MLVDPTRKFTSLAWLLPASISATINCTANVMVFKAYKLSEASVISPLTNLLPVLLLGTSYLMFRTVPSPAGVVGVSLVVAGMYYASVHNKHDLFHPFRAIWREKGARYMLGVVLLWSISTNIDKIALHSVSPQMDSFFSVTLGFVFISIYAKLRLSPAQKRYHVFRRWGWHIAAISLFSTVSVLLQLHAIQMASTSYVLALKRSDTIFTVLLGCLFLKEQSPYRRLAGATAGVAGIAIIFLGH